ncbi:Polyamine oxidase 6 [Psilocybe cubensis]|uniref:Polyamine oxidase 6 n=1 Tax=Psilocybe cubensis TaxID=181762 RepID=A0ACB8GNE2_PSICU|nr:Polyamine oxidase 6 [Psilocybe cubensis]KAH9477058.1 Polyamine oxidase 6 [Psilocybe cubensis]
MGRAALLLAISLYLQHFLSCSRFAYAATTAPPSPKPPATTKHHQVLILGGGVTGVIAARTLHERGIDDFVIVEARNELGGRMQTATFANRTIEQGPNWIQGTQEGNGPANPIFTLAKKHGVKTQFNDWFGSVSTFDATGAVDFLDVFDQSGDDFDNLTVVAGARVDQNLVDLSARTGYGLLKANAKNAHASASEYYQFDWEYAQTPEQSSLIASSWGNNFTYDTDQGGFSDDNQMSIDQRGFKTLIQQEANEFLKPQQMLLNSTVKSISYSKSGVTVTLVNGQTLTGDYALCTFSLGVLQHDDVSFKPALPDFKQEAIQSMVMATYTKIFLQFPKKFWFDTEMAIFADSERGRYPVWQSLDHKNFLPGSGILFVTVTGDYSVRIEALPDKQVKEEVMGVVRSMFPNVTVPEPLDFFFPRWHSNPLFRGSYSNWPPAFASQHLDNLRANVGRLYFAGEATSRKYFGFLHGAYFEGLDIATIMANCIKEGSCADMEHFANINNILPFENN